MDPTAAGVSCLHVDVFPAAEVSTPATGTKTALFPRGLGGLLGTPPFFAVNLPALGPISGPAVLRERKRLQGKDKDGVSGDLRRETAQGLTQLLTKGSPFDHLPCTTLRHFLLIPQPRSGCGFPISSSTTDTSQQPNKTQSPRQTWQKTCIDISRNRQTQGQKPWGKKITAITH